jgi:hypothetical protein
MTNKIKFIIKKSFIFLAFVIIFSIAEYKLIDDMEQIIKDTDGAAYMYWFGLSICSVIILACIYFIAEIFIKSKKIEN